MPKNVQPAQKFLKYLLYEKAVQSIDSQIDFFSQAYRDLNRGKNPLLLREDFCGTFAISCQWVRSHPLRRAWALDLDAEPLAYGRAMNLSQLKPSEQRKLKILQKNVLHSFNEKVDIVAACNFSFNIFKKRQELIHYFRMVRKSLKAGGLILLELVGGPGMFTVQKDRQRHQRKGKHWFTYIWDQKRFDPIHHEVEYAIHFKLGNGRMIKNAFVYDWRLWTIPEIRECMIEAGFKLTTVYWEESEGNSGNGVFYRTEIGVNEHVWLTYIAGQK